MDFPPRFVTIISLVQLFFISAGFLLTRVNINCFEKMYEDVRRLMPEIPAIARFVDAFGLRFLLVPALYFTVFVLRARSREGIVGVTLTEFAVGIMLTLSVALFFSVSALVAFLALW